MSVRIDKVDAVQGDFALLSRTTIRNAGTNSEIRHRPVYANEQTDMGRSQTFG